MDWLYTNITVTNGAMLFIVVGYTLVGAIITGFIMLDRKDRHGRDEYYRGIRDARGDF